MKTKKGRKRPFVFAIHSTIMIIIMDIKGQICIIISIQVTTSTPLSKQWHITLHTFHTIWNSCLTNQSSYLVSGVIKKKEDRKRLLQQLSSSGPQIPTIIICITTQSQITKSKKKIFIIHAWKYGITSRMATIQAVHLAFVFGLLGTYLNLLSFITKLSWI